METFDIIKQLRETTKSTVKKEILTEHRDNITLQKVIRFALDPMIIFYMVKIPKYNLVVDVFSDKRLTLSQALDDLYDNVCTRKVTGDKAKIFVGKLLSNLSESDAEVLKLILKKDLDCGVKEGLANKIWKDLILSFPLMLCERSKEENLKMIVYPALSQYKADGLRMISVVAKESDIDDKRIIKYLGNKPVKKGDVRFFTKIGNELFMCDHLKEQFLTLVNENSVVDGEALIIVDGEIQPRQKGNGILNKCQQGTSTLKDQSRVAAKVWDILTPDEYFVKKSSDEKYIDRFKKLYVLKKENNPKKIVVIESRIVHNKKEAKQHFSEISKAGGEGTIIKNFNAGFEDKRSKQFVKFKNELECDLRVIGFNPHKKKENQIGSLICQSECGNLIVSVGSGLKDSDRKKDFEMIYKNKIVEVYFNDLISADNKIEKSLFLPVLKPGFLRIDKTEAQTLKDIEETIEKYFFDM